MNYLLSTLKELYMKQLLLLTLTAIPFLFVACNDEGDEKTTTPGTKKDSTVNAQAEEEAKEQAKRPPTINITDTLSIKQTVLFMKDSAATVERLQAKLAEIWGVKLGAVMMKNKLKSTGPPLAWYKTNKAPYFFEAGISVDKKPAKLPSNIFVREIGVDSVTVAHFYGSYDLLPQAYEALSDWIKDHKKKPDGRPYEVYVDDPLEKDGKPKDPYKVRTDVIFPWK